MQAFPRCPASYSKGMKTSRLYLFTFLGIFLSLLLAGVVTAPLLMDYLRQTYVRLQIDVNKRQAAQTARILEDLLARGESPKDVTSWLQASVQGTQLDRGYLCMIDRATVSLLCHPDPNLVGQPLAPMGQQFRDLVMPGEAPRPWVEHIRKGAGTGGILTYPDGTVEIDWMTPVAGTDWILSSHENTTRVEAEINAIQITVMAGFALLGLLISLPASWAARRASRRYEKFLEKEKALSERLLRNVLPPPVAERLKSGETRIADAFPRVTVLFADIVGFTVLSRDRDPKEVLHLLNRIFTAFDTLAARHGLEKIKTIGDAWMCASGIPDPSTHDPGAMADLALEMQAWMHREYATATEPVHIRIGIHTGPAAAGVVGTSRFAYDLWGETVNTASRLESTCPTGHIHGSDDFREAPLMQDRFLWEDHGTVELKGLGSRHTWFLTGRTRRS